MRWGYRAWFASGCIAGVLLWAAMAAAAPPSAAERETARGLMQEGDRLSAQGDLRGALAKYQSAHAIMHVPTTGLEVARMQSQLGMLVEARGVAIEVLNSRPTPGEPQVFAEARQAATELAAQLENRVPSIKATVAPADVDYSVSIDGVQLPQAARDVAFRTNPGPHVVRIDAPGRASQTRSVTVAESQAALAHFDLPLAEADRTPQPMPPPATLEPKQASAAPARATASRDDNSDPAAAGRIRSIVGFSVGGVALAVGAVTGIMSASKVSDLEDSCPNNRCPEARRDDLSSAITLGNVSNAALAVGVLGVGWGVLELILLPSAPDSKAHASSSLRFELTGTGATLRGAL